MRWMSVLLLSAACGAKSPSTPTTPGEGDAPTVSRRVYVTWGVQNAASAGTVFLVTTDETGRAQSHPVGTYPGGCADSGPTETSTMSMTCLAGDRGTQLRITTHRGDIIVLRMAVAPGQPPNPANAEEAMRLTTETGAQIVLSGS